MGLDTREKLKGYLEREKITSVLSDTKWDRLFEALKEIEYTLDFRRKDLDRLEPDDIFWESEIEYIFGLWQKIEWLDIRAKLAYSKGVLLDEVIQDNTHLLIKAIKKSGAPYCLSEEGVRIWGYLRPGINPEWES